MLLRFQPTSEPNTENVTKDNTERPGRLAEDEGNLPNQVPTWFAHASISWFAHASISAEPNKSVGHNSANKSPQLRSSRTAQKMYQ